MENSQETEEDSELDTVFDQEWLKFNRSSIAGLKYASMKLNCSPCVIHTTDRNNNVIEYYNYDKLIEFYKAQFHHDIKNDIIYNEGDECMNHFMELVENQMVVNIFNAAFRINTCLRDTQMKLTNANRFSGKIFIYYKTENYKKAEEIFNKLNEFYFF